MGYNTKEHQRFSASQRIPQETLVLVASLYLSRGCTPLKATVIQISQVKEIYLTKVELNGRKHNKWMHIPSY